MVSALQQASTGSSHHGFLAQIQLALHQQLRLATAHVQRARELTQVAAALPQGAAAPSAAHLAAPAAVLQAGQRVSGSLYCSRKSSLRTHACAFNPVAPSPAPTPEHYSAHRCSPARSRSENLKPLIPRPALAVPCCASGWCLRRPFAAGWTCRKTGVCACRLPGRIHRNNVQDVCWRQWLIRPCATEDDDDGLYPGGSR